LFLFSIIMLAPYLLFLSLSRQDPEHFPQEPTGSGATIGWASLAGHPAREPQASRKSAKH